MTIRGLGPRGVNPNSVNVWKDSTGDRTLGCVALVFRGCTTTSRRWYAQSRQGERKCPFPPSQAVQEG